MVQGSCQCGAVRFEIEGPLRDVINCHCSICRKLSGHHWAATSAPISAIRLTEERGLAWYQSSSKARRAFCNMCGATLFYEPYGEDRWAIGAGTLDGATGLKTVKNICIEEAGDYYCLPEVMQ